MGKSTWSSIFFRSRSFISSGESLVDKKEKSVRGVPFFLIRRHTPFSPYAAHRSPHMSEMNALFALFVSPLAGRPLRIELEGRSHLLKTQE